MKTKKKETQAQAGESPPEPQENATATSPEQQAASSGQPGGNGRANAAKTPEVVYSLQSDRTTRIEVEIYVTPCVNQKGESYEQVTTVPTRYFLGNDGTWVRHNVYRIHDLPCLLFLLQKCHAWAMERRTLDRSCPI